MVSTIERLTKRPVRDAGPGDAPTDLAAAEDVRRHLSEHQLALAKARGDIDAIEEKIADQRLAKALGQRTDAAALLKLVEQREALGRTADELQDVVSALEARLAAWNANQARRHFDGLVREMQVLAAAAPEQERRFEQLAIELMELAAAMRRNERRFASLSSNAQQLAHRHGFAQARLRGPYRAPVITESFFARPETQAPFRRWFAGWRSQRPGWGA